MQSSGGVFALPPAICQQLLAMPLTADERNDVAHALMQFTRAQKPSENRSIIKNAPKPGRLRGV